MSQNPLIPPKPAEITLETLPQLFAHHRARFGGWKMEDPPERPEGVTEEEWNALGDPGKQVIVRERAARQQAERDLAAARARPAPPKNTPAPTPTPTAPTPPKPDDKPPGGSLTPEQVAELVTNGITAAFKARDDQQGAEQKAQAVQTAVQDAAKDRLHDASDALTGIDLTKVINDQGVADPEKIKAALDDLVSRKPHLAKPGSTQLQAPPGIGGGAPAAGATEAEKVTAILADMQRGNGIRPQAAAGTNS